jgi:osmotically inducible lipoprotein OsmB
MQGKNKVVQVIAASVVILCISGCGTMSKRDKNTITGAGIGAVAGAVLTGGSGIGTAGGAAVGGVIGNQIGKHKK